MKRFVLNLREIDQGDLSLVGGKALNLARLAKLPALNVPEGFCITTAAYQEAAAGDQTLKELVEELSQLTQGRQGEIGVLSRKIREQILNTGIPTPVREAIHAKLAPFGASHSFAVRSSATAEDLPDASFAGQYDSFLNVKGGDAILEYVLRCWASLFSERAVLYRLQNGIAHQDVQLAVIVQSMVSPEVAGVLFTADPISGNRKVTSINASFGLGEALVSGSISPDSYLVRDGQIIEKVIGTKEVIQYAAENQGIITKEASADQQKAQALSDGQIVALAEMGRELEALFGCPQDVEWCLVDGAFHIVQSRPITTLYPIPENQDKTKRVYVSVGHQQMMTDAMKPLGLSFYLLTTPAPMVTAGGRLFVDITEQLTTKEGRQTLLNTLGSSDPLIKDGLLSLFEQEKLQPEAASRESREVVSASDLPEPDPQTIADLVAKHQGAISKLKETIATKSGSELFEFIQEDLKRLRADLFQGLGVITAAMQASAWLNAKMAEWLGERNVSDTLVQGATDSITSQMGLDLLDVAETIRPYPDIIRYLEQTTDDNFLTELLQFSGGHKVREALLSFLEQYGMRCPGEIDLTRPRWLEEPKALLPTILNLVKQPPQSSKVLKAKRRQAALSKAQDLLARLEQLPAGAQKAQEAKTMIDLLWTFSGYREYPKYVMVSTYFIYKQALLREAEKLAQAGIVAVPEYVYYLSFEEFHTAIRTGQLNYQVIPERKREYQLYQKLTPPRLLTSEGEIIIGKYNRGDLPGNAIPGLAVSAGIVEGRARIVPNLEEADLEEGDILVTTFTDPSWTPLFLSCRGLVTEVGGLMTHGAVIAREYGLPAVVGVVDATKIIKDGQRIRVNGNEGYIQLL